MERFFWEWEPFEPDYTVKVEKQECGCDPDVEVDIDDVDFAYAIYDAVQGTKEPILRAADVDQANRVVALLNAAQRPVEAPRGDIFT